MRLTRKPTKRYALMYTRYTGYPVHPEYRAALANANQWRNSGIELCVAYHGDKEMANAEKSLVIKSGARLIDFYGQTTGRLAHLTREMAQWAIQSGIDYMGVIDEDVQFKDVSFAAHIIKHTTVYDQNVGAFGPCTPFKWATVYKASGHGPYNFNRYPWHTYGCQWYSVKMLEDTRKYWCEPLCNMGTSADVLLFILSHAHGFCNYEFHAPGYRHINGPGSKDITDTLYVTRLKRLLFETTLVEQTVAPLPGGGIYVRDVEQLARNITKYLYDHCVKQDRRGWRCQLVKDWKDVPDFLAFNRELLDNNAAW
jgi:hypothetical protein